MNNAAPTIAEVAPRLTRQASAAAATDEFLAYAADRVSSPVRPVGALPDNTSPRTRQDYWAREVEDQLSAFGRYKRNLVEDTSSVGSSWLPVRGGFVTFQKTYLQDFGAGIPITAISAWRAFHSMPFAMRAAVIARYAANVIEVSPGLYDTVPWSTRLDELRDLFGLDRAQAYALLDDARRAVEAQLRLDRAREAARGSAQ